MLREPYLDEERPYLLEDLDLELLLSLEDLDPRRLRELEERPYLLDRPYLEVLEDPYLEVLLDLSEDISPG